MTSGLDDPLIRNSRPSVFIAYPFQTRDEWIKHSVPPLLRLYGCDVTIGENHHGQGISNAVADDIARSNLLVAFLTRNQKLANGKWVPSQWVLQEIGFARGKGIPVVLVREAGVLTEAGILGDIQVIRLDAEREAFAAFIHLRSAIRKLLFNGQPEAGLAVCHLAKPGRIDHWDRQWWDVWIWISGSEATLGSIAEVNYQFPAKREQGARHGAFGDYTETDSAITVSADIHFGPGKKSKHRIVKHKITLPEANVTQMR